MFDTVVLCEVAQIDRPLHWYWIGKAQRTQDEPGLTTADNETTECERQCEYVAEGVFFADSRDHFGEVYVPSTTMAERVCVAHGTIRRYFNLFKTRECITYRYP